MPLERELKGHVMTNRRADPRFEVRIPGKLMWANGAASKDCTIRDLSEGGARVDTIVYTEVPATVDLFEARTATFSSVRSAGIRVG
jgi:hypothetical protein